MTNLNLHPNLLCRGRSPSGRYIFKNASVLYIGCTPLSQDDINVLIVVGPSTHPSGSHEVEAGGHQPEAPNPQAGKPWYFITSLAPIITSVLTIIDFCAELSPFPLPCCHPTSPKRRSLLGVSNVQILIGESESLCPIFIRIGEWTSCEPSSSIAYCRQLKSHYPRMASRLPCPISKPSIRFPLTSCPARERETRIYFENEIARERI